jgi:hypothetical protein
MVHQVLNAVGKVMEDEEEGGAGAEVAEEVR